MSTRDIGFLSPRRPRNGQESEEAGGQGTRAPQHTRKNALGKDALTPQKKPGTFNNLPPKTQQKVASKQAAGLGARTGYFNPRESTERATKKRTFVQVLTEARRDALEVSRLNADQAARHIAQIENQRQQSSERIAGLLNLLQRELAKRHHAHQQQSGQFIFNNKQFQQTKLINTRLFGLNQQAQRTIELNKNAEKIQHERQKIARSLFTSAQNNRTDLTSTPTGPSKITRMSS